MELGKPLKVEKQTVDTELTTQEVAALDGVPSPVEPTEVHNKALQQIHQLRAHLEIQRQHLETTGGTLRKLFERVRSLWSKQEQSATAVVRLGIEMDHLEDKVRQASPQQIEQHLGKKLTQLQQQIEQINLVSVEIDHFTAASTETVVENENPFPVEAAGAMKNWQGEIAERTGKLGKYGQDCVRSGDGIIVVADGMSNGADSFEIARRASRRAQAILEDIPLELCHSLEEAQLFVNGKLDTMLHDIKNMPVGESGGTTLLAARYLEKFDAMIMIDIGDCEVVAVAGNHVEMLKPPLEHSNHPDAITLGFRTLRKDGKPITHKNLENEISDWDHKPLQPKDFYVENITKFKRETDRPFVYSYNLAELRQANPDQPIHILLSSDGLQNTTGQALEQLAVDIVAKGPKQFIHDIGSEIIFGVGDEETGSGKVSNVHPFADDTTIISMTIPAEVRPAAQIKAKAVAA